MSKGALKQADEFSPGDVCDGYRIVALIAAGGMGDVYEAVQQTTGDTVAFKCLKVRHRSKEDARARMKMEAVVLSELQHANLVQVFDAGVTDSGMVWIAMERLHGQTLRELLHRAGRVGIADALYYASEIADGVDAVHEVNVIHRDLKPENVFVTTRKGVKVLDLGTGKFTGYGLNSTDRMRVIGTTAYMSPEQIKGLRIDARADVYALGLVTYEMIAGHHPLSPSGGIAGLPRAVEEVALLQLQMQPPPLTAVSAECPGYISTVVERAMAKDREARYPTMTAFARELRASRKRYIAENRLDDRPGPAAMHDRGLREKFGAPPRPSSSSRPPPASERAFGDKDTVMDLGRALSRDDLRTEQRPPLGLTAGVGTPVPAPPDHEPTLQLSPSSIDARPAPYPSAASIDVTYRDIAEHDVGNRTTHTNPLLMARSELTPEPLSIPGVTRSAFSRFFHHPVVRRSAATLGLGALIGVPPAIIGVLWTAQRRATVTQVAPVPAQAPSLGAVHAEADAPAAERAAGNAEVVSGAERPSPFADRPITEEASPRASGSSRSLDALPSAAADAPVDARRVPEGKPPRRPKSGKPRAAPVANPDRPGVVAAPNALADLGVTGATSVAVLPSAAPSVPPPPPKIVLPPSGL